MCGHHPSPYMLWNAPWAAMPPTAQAQTLACPQCGAAVQPNFAWCPQCGAALQGQTPARPQVREASRPALPPAHSSRQGPTALPPGQASRRALP